MKRVLVFTTLTVLFVAVYFLASVFLPPLAAPAHALTDPTAVASQIVTSTGVSGTLASFTALIPELETLSLPFISR